MSLLCGPLRTSWRVASTATWHSTLESRELLFSPLPSRGARLVRAHGISTVSSDTRTNIYANYARSVVDLVLSALVTLGMFLHNGRQGSVFMNWALPGEVQNPVPTSGRPIPPNTGKRPFPMVTPERTSTQRTLSFSPVRPCQMMDTCLEIYDALERESLEISNLPKEEAVMTSAPLVPLPITRDYPVLLPSAAEDHR
jgi:hypothetical protein